MASKRGSDGKPIIVKKYPNRRLYDTGQSTYVTLEDLRDMVQENVNFVVQDAKTGKDITREVLTQVVADQESRGEGEGNGGLLPTGFLRKLIAFYGLPTQSMVSAYLEHTLDLFISNQERLQAQINKSFDGLKTVEGLLQHNPMLEELSKQNREIIDRALNVIDPFGTLPRAGKEGQAKTG